MRSKMGITHREYGRGKSESSRPTSIFSRVHIGGSKKGNDQFGDGPLAKIALKPLECRKHLRNMLAPITRILEGPTARPQTCLACQLYPHQGRSRAPHYP